ncbi:MAG: TIGR03617 family F420-dependent LLM class oxidoreductase [Polyangiales bacterium]
MKLDGALLSTDLARIPDLARELADIGFDGLFTFDGPHEPFLPLLLAAEHTKLDLATGVAIAFARNPMTVAQTANDLQAYSGGRFRIGLGSQIKPHIEHRYSMPWSRPAARMREFVRAMKAIFACWNEGAPLRFEGEFYSHTLMPAPLRPGRNPHGAPPILLGGVGPKMLEVAGEVADGYVVHPFHSAKYLEQQALPSLREGLARSGRSLDRFEIHAQVLVVSGKDEQEFAQSKFVTRTQIGFYGSTPAYQAVLAAEDHGHLHEHLRTLTKENRWAELGGAITDELLGRIAVVGTPKECARILEQRYGKLATRLAFASPHPLSREAAAEIVDALRSRAPLP